MTTYYYGTTHIFTSRDSTDIITLKAGSGETLNVSGLGPPRISSDLAGGGPLQVPPQNVQDPQVTQLPLQGSSVAVAETADDKVVLIGCQFTGDPSVVPRKGGTSIYRSHLGAEFIKDTTIVTQTTTNAGVEGQFCDINEDCSLVVVTNKSGNANISLFQHNVSWVWSAFNSAFIAGVGAKISGPISAPYLFAHAGGALRVYLFTGGTWDPAQIILPIDGPAHDHIGISAANSVIAYYDTGVGSGLGEGIFCYVRTGTTWNASQTLTFTGVVSLNLKGSVLVAANTTTVNIWEFSTGLFSLTTSIPYTGVKEVCTNGTLVFITTSTGIQAYKKVSGQWSTNGAISPVIGGPLTTLATAASANVFVIGKPATATYGSTDIYPIVAYTPTSVLQNEVDTDQTNMILTSYRGMVDVQEKLRCVDLEVVGNIVKTGYPALTQPSIQPSTWIYDNEFNHTMGVSIWGGTVSSILINGTATGLTSGTFILPYRNTISITYTVAPQWRWYYAD